MCGQLSDESGIVDFVDPVEGDIRIEIKSDQPCSGLIFSLDELEDLHHHLTNALEYYKDCGVSDEYSSDVKENIRKSEIGARNLQAKLAHYFAKFRRSFDT